MAYPFAAADVLTAVDLNAMIGAPTQNTQTGTTYTAVLLDAGKTVTLSNASAVTLTIPAQASISWADNTQLNFLNIGAGTVTITPAVGVTINGTPLTLTTSQRGSLVRTASNTWTFTPTGGGKVLQVVRATDGTERSTTSGTFVDVTGMTVTITPQKSTSAIMVFATGKAKAQWTTGIFQAGEIRLTDSANTAMSGAETLTIGTNRISLSATPARFFAPFTIIGYATPATTSPVTYKLRFLSESTDTTFTLMNNVNIGQMFAIEVAA